MSPCRVLSTLFGAFCGLAVCAITIADYGGTAIAAIGAALTLYALYRCA